MVSVKIGILSFQGDIPEQILSVKRAMSYYKINGEICTVKSAEDVEKINALIIPGGESTTIRRHLEKRDTGDTIIKRARNGMGIMGTCAGCVLLAKEVISKNKVCTKYRLNLMDMRVVRNAYGSQVQSFEGNIDIEGIGKYKGVFIRAPVIEKVWNDCVLLSGVERHGFMARQRNLIAATFHPELTDDPRVHGYFFKICGFL